MEHTKKEIKAAAARLKRSRVANEATQELHGMVNAKSTKCAHEDCKTTPSCTKDVKHGLFIIT
jgi:hypothetical protein